MVTYERLLAMQYALFERYIHKDLTDEEYITEWDQLLEASGWSLESYVEKVNSQW